MLNKIKEFLFGKPTQLEVEVKAETPYKVEAVAPVVEPIAETASPMPIGIEAVVATPVAKATPKAPAKPKAEKATKVAAVKVPAVKKPRVPKIK